VHLARIALIGLIAVAAAGCRVPVAAGPPGPPIDSRAMPALSVVQICSLLSADEATGLLGAPLAVAPAGIGSSSHDAQCVYQTGVGAAIGAYIRVEIDDAGFSNQAVLVNLHRGAHTLNVGGYQAIGADAQADPSVAEAVLSVMVATLTSDPALWIEAPTSAIARQVAVLILPRLAALH
jgi:hypothetical protein